MKSTYSIFGYIMLSNAVILKQPFMLPLALMFFVLSLTTPNKPKDDDKV